MPRHAQLKEIITSVLWERNRGSSYSDLEVTSPNPKNPEPSGLPGVLRCACTLPRKTNNNEQTVLLSACVFQSWKLFQDCVTIAPIRQVNSLPRRLFPLDLQVRRKGLSWSPPITGSLGLQLAGHLQDPRPKVHISPPGQATLALWEVSQQSWQLHSHLIYSRLSQLSGEGWS